MKLDDYLARKRLSPIKFAEAIGVNASTLWRIRLGKQRPKWTTLEAIDRETGGKVTANDFLDKA